MTRVGLTLGSGGVRGLAHIGVLLALERASVQIDVISGTSVGAVIGAAYASGMSPGEMADLAQTLRWSELVRPSLTRRSLFDTSKFDAFLNHIIAARDFEEMRFAYAAIARDLHSGHRVVLSRGNPVGAARASAAVRGVFAPVQIDGRWLVDGASVDALPTCAARALGADYVIAVDVRNTKRSDCDDVGDLVIRPALDRFSTWKFGGAHNAIAVGEQATEEALAALAGSTPKSRWSWSVRSDS